MLASTTAGAIIPTYEEFRLQAIDLQNAVGQWFDAREAGEEGEAERGAAKEAWRSAMIAWQRAEVMMLGPAGSAADFTGGLGLRDEIYSWPGVNTCRVDQEIVELAWDDEDFFSANLVNVYGLDALEYLIFEEGLSNSCAPQLAINAEGLWDAIPADQLDWRRASYSFSLTLDLVRRADTLLDAWSETGGAFGLDLASAGEDGSSFFDQSAAMDELFACLFYLELILEDRKLAEPLGFIDCSTGTCPQAFESQHADLALESALANLEGGLRLYRGGDEEGQIGLEELLLHNDFDSVDAEVQAAFSSAIAALEAVPSSALVQIEDDVDPLLSAYAAVQAVTNLLVGDVAVALLLEIPAEAANDND